jgi:hypothetical protein
MLNLVWLPLVSSWYHTEVMAMDLGVHKLVSRPGLVHASFIIWGTLLIFYCLASWKVETVVRLDSKVLMRSHMQGENETMCLLGSAGREPYIKPIDFNDIWLDMFKSHLLSPVLLTLLPANKGLDSPIFQCDTVLCKGQLTSELKLQGWAAKQRQPARQEQRTTGISIPGIFPKWWLFPMWLEFVGGLCKCGKR